MSVLSCLFPAWKILSSLLGPMTAMWPRVTLLRHMVPMNPCFCVLLIKRVHCWWTGWLSFQCRRPGRCGFDPWVGKIPCRRKWQPTPIFFIGWDNLMDRGAWRATGHGVAKSGMCLSNGAFRWSDWRTFGEFVNKNCCRLFVYLIVFD